MENDDNIKMSVGIQNLLSIDFELEHINYNCRGTIKGLISFNYIHLPIKYVEIQLLKQESIFIEKKEPFIIESFELIDGSPIKNDVVPFRFFLKSYNLTPTYNNINNIFCVRYFINLIIGDFENNTFFKQTEIKLFRNFRKEKNPELNYGPWEEFISEPMYNEEYYNENNIIKKNENKCEKDAKDKNINNIFNEENNELEEEEYEEEDEYEENEDNEDKDDIEKEEKEEGEFIINTSTKQNKKAEENNNHKKKKKKKYGIVNILRSNSLYKGDKNNIINNQNNNNFKKYESFINNLLETNEGKELLEERRQQLRYLNCYNSCSNHSNIPFDNDEEDTNNIYINNLITTNFPVNSNNTLFNDDNNNFNNNKIINNNNNKIIKFDD